jgi:hypothetical protein
MMTRRTFLSRVSAAVGAAVGALAAVYAPSCLRALEPVEPTEFWTSAVNPYPDVSTEEILAAMREAKRTAAPAPGTYVTIPNGTYFVLHPTA